MKIITYTFSKKIYTRKGLSFLNVVWSPFVQKRNHKKNVYKSLILVKYSSTDIQNIYLYLYLFFNKVKNRACKLFLIDDLFNFNEILKISAKN